MDFLTQRNIVFKHFEAVNQRYSQLKNISKRQELTDFDFEIMLHLLRDLYSEIEYLKQSVDVDILKASDSKIEHVQNAEVKIQVETEDKKTNEEVEPKIESSNPIDEINNLNLEQLVEEVKNKTRSNQTIQPNIHEERIAIPEVEVQKEDIIQPEPVLKTDKEADKNEIEELKNKILYDKFKKSGTSLNEKLTGDKNETSIGEKFGTDAVNDLKKSIGINDRFSFTNDLFGGSKQEFDLFINQVSVANDRDSILKLIEQTASIRNWDKTKSTYISFISLIDRFLQGK